jgi:hypothetical protein
MAENSFGQFCRQATDQQLEDILKKEFEAAKTGDESRYDDYCDAVKEASHRGWTVINGERL